MGDYVRLSFLKRTFEREYDQKWTSEIFFVKARRIRDGPQIYTIADFEGEELIGTFYKEEIQKVSSDPKGIYKIEKILRERKQGDRKQFLVCWLYWPSKYDSWVNAKDLQDL